MNFRVADVATALVSDSKSCHNKNTAIIDEDGSHMQNPASGRKATMRVENRVCVIEMYLKDLVGHARPRCWARTCDTQACKTVRRMGRKQHVASEPRSQPSFIGPTWQNPCVDCTRN